VSTGTPKRLVVPLAGVNTHCAVEGGKLVSLNPLPAVGHGERAVDDEAGWVVWVADQGSSIGLTHLDAGPGEAAFAPLPMPPGYKAACLAFCRQTLFVGGDCGKEVIGSFDLAVAEPGWTPLEVPDRFRRQGKRIDDLLIDGDRLVAVDDVVYPKFLLVYDITEPRRPRLVETRDIRPHDVYEHIRCGAVGATWVALLSISDGMWGGQSFVSLFDRAKLAEYGWLTAPRTELRARMISPDNKQAPRTWHGVALLGDVLLLAAGRDGVGVLDLSKVPRPSGPIPFDESASSMHEPSDEHAGFMRRCEGSLQYVRPPGVVGPVLRVEPVAGTRHCLAVYDGGAGLDSAVVTLP
jgi:hypothetical protein